MRRNPFLTFQLTAERAGFPALLIVSAACLALVVVPVALLNTDEIQPTGKLIPKIKRVKIRFGAPLDFTRYAAALGDRFGRAGPGAGKYRSARNQGSRRGKNRGGARNRECRA